MKPSLTNAEGRKAWALLALIGAAQVFTLFAAYAAYQVRHSPGLSFWMGLAAHVQILIVLAAFAWLLGVRRTVKISKDGAELEDRE